jgi:GTPase SAR1 family protein
MYIPTTAMEFSKCTIRVRGAPSQFEIWDTADQEQFLAVAPSSCARRPPD